jgi:hypothetical protein
VPVNLDLLAPKAPRTHESWTAVKFFPGRNPSAWAKFAPNYPAVHHDAINHSDDPEYYARHVPWVGAIAMRVFQQSKAHPRLTRVFQVIQPQF